MTSVCCHWKTDMSFLMCMTGALLLYHLLLQLLQRSILRPLRTRDNGEPPGLPLLSPTNKPSGHNLNPWDISSAIRLKIGSELPNVALSSVIRAAGKVPCYVS